LIGHSQVFGPVLDFSLVEVGFLAYHERRQIRGRATHLDHTRLPSINLNQLFDSKKESI